MADFMGLRDWTIIVGFEPPGANYSADIDCRYGRKVAVIRFSDNFLESDPDRQRQTIAHELLHCHFEPMRRLMLAMVETSICDATHLPFEYGIDGVAEEWAKFLPLPFFEDEKPMAKKKTPPAFIQSKIDAKSPPTQATKAKMKGGKMKGGKGKKGC
jgi:hypothetical protein